MDSQGDLIALAVRRRADQPLAPQLVEQGMQLHLQRDAGQPLPVVAKGDAWRLREVMQCAVDGVHVIDVQLDAAALQQVKQVGFARSGSSHTAPG